MNVKLLLFSISIILIASCKKVEGPGGTSSINGIVMGMNHESAKAEVTEIIFTNGLQVEHGDYFLLNTPNSNNFYYVWYDNPTWISNGDPMLSGRIGIKVEFNYTDSNTAIADSTLSALGNYSGGDFSFELINDVLILTNTEMGEVPDADEVTSPFEFNIVDQGKNSELNQSMPLVDEKVYLVYGSGDYSSDDVRTGVNGEFQFTGLTKGDYSVYVISKDTINGGSEKIEVEISIADKKSVNDIGTINVIY